MSAPDSSEPRAPTQGAPDRQRRDSPQSPPRTQQWKGMGSYGTVGLEIVLSILLGLFLGRYLDSKFETDPVITVIGIVAGVGAAIKAIVRATREMREAAKREEAEEGNPEPMFPKAGWRQEAKDPEAPAAEGEGDGDPTPEDAGNAENPENKEESDGSETSNR